MGGGQGGVEWGGQDPFGVCMQYGSAVYPARKEMLPVLSEMQIEFTIFWTPASNVLLNLESHKEYGTR